MSERLDEAYWNLVDAVKNFADEVVSSEYVVGGLSMLKRDMRFIKDLAALHGVDVERRADGISKGS
jgi:hypothetical protein